LGKTHNQTKKTNLKKQTHHFSLCVLVKDISVETEKLTESLTAASCAEVVMLEIFLLRLNFYWEKYSKIADQLNCLIHQLPTAHIIFL
jgi:hypothetical protein